MIPLLLITLVTTNIANSELDVKQSVGKLFSSGQVCSSILIRGEGISSNLSITSSHCLKKAIKYANNDKAKSLRKIQVNFYGKKTIFRDATISYFSINEDWAALILDKPIKHTDIPGVKITNLNKFNYSSEVALGYPRLGGVIMLNSCKTKVSHKFSTPYSIRSENCNSEDGMSGGGYFGLDENGYHLMGMLDSKGAVAEHVTYYTPILLLSKSISFLTNNDLVPKSEI